MLLRSIILGSMLLRKKTHFSTKENGFSSHARLFALHAFDPGLIFGSVPGLQRMTRSDS